MLAGLAALAVVAHARTASAQSADDALRRDLVVQAEQARDAGEHARAIDLATRAAQLRMTPSLALMLAQENEQLGHVVDALDHARRCTSDATADAAMRNRELILRLCHEITSTLEARVARLTVRLPSEPAVASVQVGSRALPQAGWDVAVPVDPGDVVVRATSTDGRSFEQTVHVANGASAEVTVTFTAPSGAARTSPPSTPVVTSAAVVAPPDATPRIEHARSGPGAGPWVVAGVGAVVLGTAGVLWAMHGGAISDRDAACDAGGCDPSSVDADSRARSLTTAANVSLAVGSAAVVGGLVWFLIARTRTSDAHEVRPTAWVTPGGAGVMLGGTL